MALSEDEKEKELLYVLGYIRDTCCQHICKECPLGNCNGLCMMHEAYPENWQLKNDPPKDNVNRLFKNAYN